MANQFGVKTMTGVVLARNVRRSVNGRQRSYAASPPRIEVKVEARPKSAGEVWESDLTCLTHRPWADQN
jgi:hypothetical protein